MLNQSLKLNTKIFSNNIENKSTRDGFGVGLLEIGTKNEKVVALSADLTESTRTHLFKEKFPNRFIQVGISEQNMAGVASGLASMGKIPYITSFAIFNPGRNWEQIRTTICYNNQPVKIIGTHSGITVGEDGGSHQSLEDIALTTSLPNMIVISPCDNIEARKATIACANNNLPTYIRLDRNNTPFITTEDTPFEIGKSQILFYPEKGIAEIGIIATGTIVYRALIAAKNLEKEGIKVKVMNLSTIKPLDEEGVLSIAKETKAIVTVEDHGEIGGMGSMIASFLSKNYPVPIEFIAIKNKFGQSGKKDELIEHYEIGISHIENAVKKVKKRKILN
ncbi:TPA: transketolase [Candidatus Nomurabacteria bacterium]|nr:MAG: Transketolase, central region [Parcubacteria bacterium RAAC4_OD1_1]HCY26603.1 transketolase [Candidatus Nomurabacteria bacterium]